VLSAPNLPSGWGAIWVALNAAEGKILPSVFATSPALMSEEANGFLQPFLGLGPPDSLPQGGLDSGASVKTPATRKPRNLDQEYREC